MAIPNISAALAQAKILYDNIVSQLIASNEIGQVVRLHYAPQWETSTAPQFNSWGSNASINATPSLGALEPSQKLVEVTEEVRMRVYSTDTAGYGRNAFKTMGGAKYVNGEILTLGLMTDYSKVVDCIKADFYLNTESTAGRKTYKLITDVTPYGFGKDTFYFCFWGKYDA